MDTPDTATRIAIVTYADTAKALDPSLPPAASTPFLLSLAELTCCDAISTNLSQGDISVGVRAEIEHLAPSRVGAEISAHASVTARRDRRLTFEVTLFERDLCVATVNHERAIVSYGRLMERLDADA